MKKLFVALLAFGLCQAIDQAPKTINYLVDLNGVVVGQSTYSFTRSVGWFNFIGAYNPNTLQATLFDYHRRVKPLQDDTPRAYYHNRYVISQIQCDYLRGLVDSNTVLQMVNAKLDQLKPTIDSKRKVELIRTISNVMFTPKLFADTVVRLKDGYHLIKWINGKNTPGSTIRHRIIFVSNWDKESFPYLYKNPELAKLFDLADEIIISGNIGLMKPDPAFYEYVFKECNIDPNKEITFYIDDEPCNIEAAEQLEKLRFYPILYKGCKKTKRFIKKHYSSKD